MLPPGSSQKAHRRMFIYMKPRFDWGRDRRKGGGLVITSKLLYTELQKGRRPFVGETAVMVKLPWSFLADESRVTLFLGQGSPAPSLPEIIPEHGQKANFAATAEALPLAQALTIQYHYHPFIPQHVHPPWHGSWHALIAVAPGPGRPTPG